MTIDGLNALTTLTAGDELPVWDVEASAEEPTKKITAQNMANSVKTLANLQGALTFDTTPTTGSTNPVTSGGVATAIQQSTAITTGTATRNTTYTLASNLRYSVFGKIVVVHGWVKLSSDAMSAGGHEIASGLPPCLAPMDTASLFAYDQASKKMVCLVIRTTGKIETDNTTLDTSANGNVINFNATYIAQ